MLAALPLHEHKKQFWRTPVLWIMGAAFLGSFVTAFGNGWIAWLTVLLLALSLAVMGQLIHERINNQTMVDILQKSLHAIHDAVYIINPNSQTIYANPAGYDFLGKTNDPLLLSLESRLRPDDRLGRERLVALREAANKNGGEVDLRIVTSAKKQETILISAAPIEGAPGFSLWRIVRDQSLSPLLMGVTPELSQLIQLIASLPIGLFVQSEEGRLLVMNDQMQSWLAYKSTDLMQSEIRLEHIIASQTEGDLSSAVENENELPKANEVTMKTKDGDIFQAFLGYVKGEKISGGFMLREEAAHGDWESAFRRSRLLFKRFFEAAPMGIVLVDLESRITEANHFFRTMMEKTFGVDITGRPIADFVSEDDHESLTNILAAAVAADQGESPDPADIHLLTNEDKVVSLYISRMEDEFGAAFGLMLHFVDVTEQKSLEVQVVQSQKMQAVGQLAGGIAHDFNNLLTAMIGFCDLLLSRHKPGDQSFGDIQQIKQNANRAANLVRQLLAFSRQQQLKPKILSIIDALSELSHLLRRLLGEKVTLDMTYGREVGMVKVDQGQLEQVIINLAVNARDAMSDGGKLIIKTENVSFASPTKRGSEIIPPGDYVRIDVSDQGIGIPEENLTRIFDPFFTTKDLGAGTGLGLSTVYGIVKQTGGFLIVESVVGKGTTFTIFLPRYDATAKAQEEEDDVPEEKSVKSEDEITGDLTGAGTILLVEDEDAVRMFTSRALGAKGYKIVEAENGRIAIDLLTSENPPKIDLVITDVMMPEMDGPTMIKEIRKQKLVSNADIICVSGYAEDTLREKIGDDENIHFLPKPYSLKQLAAKVKDILNKEE